MGGIVWRRYDKQIGDEHISVRSEPELPLQEHAPPGVRCDRIPPSCRQSLSSFTARNISARLYSRYHKQRWLFLYILYRGTLNSALRFGGYLDDRIANYWTLRCRQRQGYLGQDKILLNNGRIRSHSQGEVALPRSH